MNARDLLPCPFCGGGVTLFDWGDGYCLIRCDDQSACAGSGLWSGFMQKDTDTAIAAWNRRDPAVILAAALELPEVKALVKGLERIAEYKPSFDYVGSDDYGIRPDLPGSPYDRGKDDCAKHVSGMARATLAALKPDAKAAP
jgi:hypothetical protein